MPYRVKKSNMVTQQIDNAPVANPVSRAPAIWSVIIQLIFLGILALALIWSPEQDFARTATLAKVSAIWLIILLVPQWRRSEVYGICAGLILALICWFSVGTSLTTTNPEAEQAAYTDYIPRILPYLLAGALMLAIGARCMRIKTICNSGFGIGAQIAALVMLLLSIFLYYITAPFGYAMEADKFTRLISTVLLYPYAFWLGIAALNLAERGIILPIGSLALIAAFLLHIIGGGG